MTDTTANQPAHGFRDRKEHRLFACRTRAEFIQHFEEQTGCSISAVTDAIVASAEPRAMFLVGSTTQGTATSASDIDFITLVDGKDALCAGALANRNSSQSVAFSNETEVLVAGNFIRMVNHIQVDVTVALVPGIRQVYQRLQRRGPELSERELMTLSRLKTGWMLWESDGYLATRGCDLQDPALDIYSATRNFTFALVHREKSRKAKALNDIMLSLHLARLSVELAFLAFLASEGYAYLGPKWLAQFTHPGVTRDRYLGNPILQNGLGLLFPQYPVGAREVDEHLDRVSAFLTSMRALIEERPMFAIAFRACPQIYRI